MIVYTHAHFLSVLLYPLSSFMFLVCSFIHVVLASHILTDDFIRKEKKTWKNLTLTVSGKTFVTVTLGWRMLFYQA